MAGKVKRKFKPHVWMVEAKVIGAFCPVRHVVNAEKDEYLARMVKEHPRLELRLRRYVREEE